MVLCLVWITYFNGDQHYLILSLLCLVFSMLPFYWHFEMKRSEAREIVFLAVLATMAAMGRVAMAAFPDVKPTSFIVIVTALALGPESGFIVGSTAAIVSNLFLGQGPGRLANVCLGHDGRYGWIVKKLEVGPSAWLVGYPGIIYGFFCLVGSWTFGMRWYTFSR